MPKRSVTSVDDIVNELAQAPVAIKILGSLHIRSMVLAVPSTVLPQSPTTGTNFAPPSDLIPPLSFTHPMAAFAPCTDRLPLREKAPDKGKTAAILISGGWARRNVGKPTAPIPPAIKPFFKKARRVIPFFFFGITLPPF